MNGRKCPKCGGFVPTGNNNCNHCGHKMFMFGGNGLYVGSSSNANKLNTKESPFSDGKNNNGCVVFIFVLIILFPVITSSLSVIFEEFEKEGLTFENILEDMFSDEDYYYDEEYDEDYLGSNVCEDYCGDLDYEVANGYCMCANGSIYNNDGVKQYVDNSSEKNYSNSRCSLFCDEDAAYLGGACYCKSGNRYDYYSAEPIGKSDSVVIQNLINDLDSKKNVLIYGPGDGEGNYTFGEPIDPVKLDTFMRDYDYQVYFLDYDGIFSEARDELVQKYNIVDFSVPYYYLFRNGEAIKNGVFFNSLDELKQVLDDNSNIAISQ